MKKSIGKLTAIVSAAAMTVTMCAASIPAFAAEAEAVNAQAYVNSFGDEVTRAVAQYLVDNSPSFEEAQEMMREYFKGVALRESSESNSGIALANTVKTHTISGPYYNGTRVAGTEHRAALLVMDTSAELDCTLTVTWSDTVNYDTTNKPYTIMSEYDDLSFVAKENINSGTRYIRLMGFIYPTTSGAGNTAGVLCTFPIGYDDEIANSEAAIVSAFTLDTSNVTSENGIDSTIQLHTYALGDYDHNGIVNAADSSYLLELLAHYDVNFVYSTFEVGVVGPISVLAADGNEDGKIDYSDVAFINQHSA